MVRPVADRETRAARLARPLARDVVKAVAEAHGACIRPVQLRKTNLDTGETEQVLVPCGATLASICPPCAERNKALRAAQCREGWHLENEPIPAPVPPDDYQQWLTATRADLQTSRDLAAEQGEDTAELDELIGSVDDELRRTGIRGSIGTGQNKARRRRSTRRRQDTPDLPRRTIDPRTVGRTYTAPRWQGVPAVDVPHPHLRQLRHGQPRRHPGRPGQLHLRWGELAALTRGHIDLAACTVHVASSLTETDGGALFLGPPKSAASRRTVQLPPLLVPILRNHLDRYALPGADNLVFTGPHGAMLRRSNFRRRVWLPALADAGLPDIHFHDLRHTGNILTATAGASLRELMARMGHASTRAALVYLHDTDDRQRIIAAAVSDLAGRSWAIRPRHRRPLQGKDRAREGHDQPQT
jgi:integrase